MDEKSSKLEIVRAFSSTIHRPPNLRIPGVEYNSLIKRRREDIRKKKIVVDDCDENENKKRRKIKKNDDDNRTTTTIINKDYHLGTINYLNKNKIFNQSSSLDYNSIKRRRRSRSYLTSDKPIIMNEKRRRRRRRSKSSGYSFRHIRRKNNHTTLLPPLTVQPTNSRNPNLVIRRRSNYWRSNRRFSNITLKYKQKPRKSLIQQFNQKYLIQRRNSSFPTIEQIINNQKKNKEEEEPAEKRRRRDSLENAKRLRKFKKNRCDPYRISFF